MTTKIFAPQYSRDDDGRVLFPPDHVRRKEIFLPESFDHPAKAHMLMIEELIAYLSEPGDTIVDPFGGSGTLLVGMITGRMVGLIELTTEYYDLCVKNSRHIMSDSSHYYQPSIHNGPNQQLIPNFQNIQAFIFSPPYAGALKAGGSLTDWGGYSHEHTDTYSDTGQLQGNMSPFNLAGFNNFMFNQEMKKIYKLCLAALKPGGFIVVIIKDRISQGVKEEFGYRAFRDLLDIGYEAYDWQRIFMLGSHYTKWHRARGTKVIDEEHLVIMRKPL
jgi:hypothetical protein